MTDDPASPRDLKEIAETEQEEGVVDQQAAASAADAASRDGDAERESEAHPT